MTALPVGLVVLINAEKPRKPQSCGQGYCSTPVPHTELFCYENIHKNVRYNFLFSGY